LLIRYLHTPKILIGFLNVSSYEKQFISWRSRIKMTDLVRFLLLICCQIIQQTPFSFCHQFAGIACHQIFDSSLLTLSDTNFVYNLLSFFKEIGWTDSAQNLSLQIWLFSASSTLPKCTRSIQVHFVYTCRIVHL